MSDDVVCWEMQNSRK